MFLYFFYGSRIEKGYAHNYSGSLTLGYEIVDADSFEKGRLALLHYLGFDDDNSFIIKAFSRL